MLPLEKCLELKAAGYRLLAREHCPICECMDDDPYIPPSGDELLAECVKLLPDGDWFITRETFKDGASQCYIKRASTLPPVTEFSICDDQPDNADLADCWLWLKKRKDREK